jgi:hypothetical protein
MRRDGDATIGRQPGQNQRLDYLSEAISKLHASNRFEAARIAPNKRWL